MIVYGWIVGYILGFDWLINERIKEGGNQGELTKKTPQRPYWRSVRLRVQALKQNENNFM